MDYRKLIDSTEISAIEESWFRILAQKKREVRFAGAAGKSRPLIAVFGSAVTEPNSRIWRSAYRLGRSIALGGGVVMNGGYAGVMQASAEGARSAGGHTIGVTCTNLPEREANPAIAEEWRLERWDQRLLALVWLADGYAVFPGSSGTLVELAMVVETQFKRFIPPRAVVCVGKFWEPVVRRIDGTRELVAFAATPEEAAAKLLE